MISMRAAGIGQLRRDVVDDQGAAQAYPPNATTAADKAAQGIRDSLEGMLNLSSGSLRNPLTVLTIATPLVTAALTAFVPEIGK